MNTFVDKNKQFDLILYIESAIAVINLPDICKIAKTLSKNSRFVPCALVFGSDDFCANIGNTQNIIEIGMY